MNSVPQRTWVITKAVIASPDGTILALRRSHTAPFDALRWDLPGGIVEFGEDPVAATIRETSEETGITVTGPQPFLVFADNTHREYAVLIFFQDRVEATDVTLSYEHDQFQWVTPEQFLSLETAPNLRRGVEAWSHVQASSK